jgi:hypothetical protein
MSAEKGWIGEPQPTRERILNRSRASAARDWVEAEQRRREEAGDTRPVRVKW